MLAGGGIENYYISEQELKTSSLIEINAGSLETPDTLDKLQKNYLLFETKRLGVLFK